MKRYTSAVLHALQVVLSKRGTKFSPLLRENDLFMGPLLLRLSRSYTWLYAIASREIRLASFCAMIRKYICYWRYMSFHFMALFISLLVARVTIITCKSYCESL